MNKLNLCGDSNEFVDYLSHPAFYVDRSEVHGRVGDQHLKQLAEKKISHNQIEMARMINVAKTMRMPIEKRIASTTSTEDDINNMLSETCKYACDKCGRRFPNIRGVAAHKAIRTQKDGSKKSYCLGPGTVNVKSRQGQKADLMVKDKNVKISLRLKMRSN